MKFEYPKIQEVSKPLKNNGPINTGGRSGMGMCKNTYTLKFESEICKNSEH